MFNKLVVSTNERRSNRTTRFFFGTSIIYLVITASALALSVFFADAKLADSGNRTGIMITPVPPPLLGSRRPESRHQPSQDSTRQDSNNVRSLDDILAKPAPAQASVRPGGPPRVGDIGEGMNYGPGDPDGVRDGLPQAIPIPGLHSNATDPPRPQDASRTQSRAVEPDRPMKLSSVVLQGKAVARRTPDYPQLAKQIRLEGAVSVEVIIAPDGHVESARAVSGHQLFIKAAVDSAYGWRFEPTRLNGTPVRVTGIIVFNFKLVE
jgi:TonB family protein